MKSFEKYQEFLQKPLKLSKTLGFAEHDAPPARSPPHIRERFSCSLERGERRVPGASSILGGIEGFLGVVSWVLFVLVWGDF